MKLKIKDGEIIEKKIGVITSRYTGIDFINLLFKAGYRVECVITIDEAKGKSQSVAGYVDMKKFCDQYHIECYTLKRYSMTTPFDKKLVEDLVSDKKLDLLISVDWQRLIPDWCLAMVPHGVYGIHSTSKRLPYGRGRSPINWSIIQGKKSLYVNVFKYAPGADTGQILASTSMKISERDTCHTLYLKQIFFAVEIFKHYLPAILTDTVKLLDQKDMTVQWAKDVTYPKRVPEDGEIDWYESVDDIVNFVRAQTHPFPGAFSYIPDNYRLIIYDAQEFDPGVFLADHRPGDIVHIFSDDSLLIKCGSGSILATHSFIPELEDGKPSPLSVGMHLESPKERKVWQLPE